MKRFVVCLEDKQYLSLKRAAASSHKRMSQIIREALSSYLGKPMDQVDYFSFVGIARGPAKGKASQDAEETLKKLMK